MKNSLKSTDRDASKFYVLQKQRIIAPSSYENK